MTDTNEKLARVRTFLKTHQLDAIVLTSRANIAWLSGGADAHVVSQSENGCAALVVAARSVWLVANQIEMPRLQGEEPLGQFTAKPFPWTTSLPEALDKLRGNGNGKGKSKSSKTIKAWVADQPEIAGLPPLPGDFVAEVRWPLTEQECRHFKALGRDCSLALETVAHGLEVGVSGHQVEADMARHLLARGIQPTVLLVAFDERIKRYRHPVPTANHLRRHAMLVMCGQRHGLVASLTRFVHFGKLPSEVAQRHEACCRIEAALWKATTPGATWASALQAGIDQYATEGFAKEWELHHQGGPAGYGARDFLVTPVETRSIVDHVAVAWNPSITGAKSEDTFILDGDERHVITAASANWPSVTAKANGLTLQRPGILCK